MRERRDPIVRRCSTYSLQNDMHRSSSSKQRLVSSDWNCSCVYYLSCTCQLVSPIPASWLCRPSQHPDCLSPERLVKNVSYEYSHWRISPPSCHFLCHRSECYPQHCTQTPCTQTLCSNALYSIILYSNTLYSNILYSSILYSSILYSNILYSNTLYYRHAVLKRPVLKHPVLKHPVLQTLCAQTPCTQTPCTKTFCTQTSSPRAPSISVRVGYGLSTVLIAISRSF